MDLLQGPVLGSNVQRQQSTLALDTQRVGALDHLERRVLGSDVHRKAAVLTVGSHTFGGIHVAALRRHILGDRANPRCVKNANKH
jgi:hypothetical protein